MPIYKRSHGATLAAAALAASVLLTTAPAASATSVHNGQTQDAVAQMLRAQRDCNGIPGIQEAWVELYDDTSFRDRRLTVSYSDHPHGISNLKHIESDDGKKGFGDKTSSVRFNIPQGCRLVLHDDAKFKDSRFELIGTGQVEEVSDLGSFSDKASSLRWERT